MQFKIQLALVNPDTGAETIEEITLLDKRDDQIEGIGLTLSESKSILKSLQEIIVANQVNNYTETHRACSDCGKTCRKKGSFPITFRTLFGNVPLSSPRFYSCSCQEREQKTFSPLTDLIEEHTSPECLYLETKWASLIPFEKTVDLLKDVLPVDEKLNARSVKNHLQKIADKDEANLGEEQVMFVEGCQMQWDELPRPEGTIVVGLDGGYIRSWEEKKAHFEVVAGKSMPRDRPDKVFAFVNTCESAKIMERYKRKSKNENHPPIDSASNFK